MLTVDKRIRDAGELAVEHCTYFVFTVFHFLHEKADARVNPPSSNKVIPIKTIQMLDIKYQESERIRLVCSYLKHVFNIKMITNDSRLSTLNLSS